MTEEFSCPAAHVRENEALKLHTLQVTIEVAVTESRIVAEASRVGREGMRIAVAATRAASTATRISADATRAAMTEMRIDATAIKAVGRATKWESTVPVAFWVVAPIAVSQEWANGGVVSVPLLGNTALALTVCLLDEAA